MKLVKHYLAHKPLLSDWLVTLVPEIGTLVWVEPDPGRPLVIGDINRNATTGPLRVTGELRVTAYARVDVRKLALEAKGAKR